MMYWPSHFGWSICAKYNVGVVIVNENMQRKWKEGQSAEGRNSYHVRKIMLLMLYFSIQSLKKIYL